MRNYGHRCISERALKRARRQRVQLRETWQTSACPLVKCGICRGPRSSNCRCSRGDQALDGLSADSLWRQNLVRQDD